MNAEATRTRPGKSFPGLLMLWTALACGVAPLWRTPPSAAAGHVTVSQRDALKVIGSAVSHYYQKEVARRVVESACYFDPWVEDSMRCAWHSNTGGADPYRLQQKTKRRATKRCREAGGRSCVLFWSNGSFRFEGLSPSQAEKMESALTHHHFGTRRPLPLPEGIGVGQRLVTRFEQIRDRYEERRMKRRGRNLSYALCANERGPYASFSMSGGWAIDPSEVRRMCVLKCEAISRFVDREGKCYVVYGDGEFASLAAEQAIMR